MALEMDLKEQTRIEICTHNTKTDAIIVIWKSKGIATVK